MATVSFACIAARSNPTILSPKTLNPIIPPYLSLHFNRPPTSISISISSPSRIRSSASDPVIAPLTSDQSLTLKRRLSSGDTLYGLFLLSSSPTLAEIAGLAGYDYVVVDMEHSSGGISNSRPCLRALSATHTPAILRLPELSPTWVKKALDLGPQGIMFPMIEIPTAAELAVSYCRSPPSGIRGSAHTVVRASAYGIEDGYLTRCEEDLLIMCQVETSKGVEMIEEIAKVELVDCVQMGPLDLSASTGYLWDPGNRKVRAVMKEAERRLFAVKKSYLGGFAMPHDRRGDLKMRGYHMVAGAVDLEMFRKAAVEDVMRFSDTGGDPTLTRGDSIQPTQARASQRTKKLPCRLRDFVVQQAVGAHAYPA